jgi:hypothetical protein
MAAAALAFRPEGSPQKALTAKSVIGLDWEYGLGFLVMGSRGKIDRAVIMTNRYDSGTYNCYLHPYSLCKSLECCNNLSADLRQFWLGHYFGQGQVPPKALRVGSTNLKFTPTKFKSAWNDGSTKMLDTVGDSTYVFVYIGHVALIAHIPDKDSVADALKWIDENMAWIKTWK